MIKIILMSLFCLYSFPVFAEGSANVPLNLKEHLAHAAYQAANKPLLFSLYFNDKSKEELFGQVLVLVASYPPEGKDSFVSLAASKYPKDRVNLVFDTRANLARQLRANGADPAQILQSSTDGLTLVDRNRKDGLRVFNVFVITDQVAKASDNIHRASAQALVSLAHEIYGHVYHSLNEPGFLNQSSATQERVAYTESIAFLNRLIASPMFQKIPAASQKEIRAALVRDQQMLVRMQKLP